MGSLDSRMEFINGEIYVIAICVSRQIKFVSIEVLRFTDCIQKIESIEKQENSTVYSTIEEGFSIRQKFGSVESD